MLKDKLTELKYRLAERFVQREAEITAVLAGLLSGEPTILVGEVGTAKTALIENLASMIDARYFYYLLTRFTEPDEILGVLDINALREGKYVRRTEGKLPQAEIVFLDEIFKASSAIRNILLDIILNKRIFSDGSYIRLPMLALYTASNEISGDVEDAPFYDRLTIRCFVKGVSEDSWEELIEKGVELDLGVESDIVMSVNDVKSLQNAVMEKFRQITSNRDLIRRYIEALVRLKQRGVKISDRRKIKVLKVASAISFVYGENDVSLDSLAEALKLTAVHDEEDLKKVEQIILELGLSSFYQHVQKIQVVTAELQNALNASLNGGMEELKMLSTIYKKASTLMDEIPKNPRLLPYIRQFKQVYSRAEDVLERKKAELFGI
ncbi:AAA family ATPase [Archaeoglobus profundus]|uniref:ATPase associated with various cellular activities AAA_5 n=1 Tax=Archaeoglobus profundus (strain DSM 5631 / JCM 9629 / NBRC 100127 / Av18) TaxID=572546 RepID=D2RGP6_ARCPA|nr:AAA family ATPase [Archaeoglobus profundus]ADB57471.1 ATPase associated with various cellular activities AAA_5 [Archaeoglobus profundus DSM 5631]